MTTSTRTLWAPVLLGLILPAMVSSCQGCKKDEPPPPLPSATVAPTASAPVLELAVEDAGEDVVDAADAGKKVGGGGGGNIKKCCQAIKQNAANAPMPTKAYLENLAASCFAMAAQGKTSFPGGSQFAACK